ncbi:sugar transferase [Patescibacteria group bacterium]|nr:sugar transferase [Patescibacteria group bacterium]
MLKNKLKKISLFLGDLVILVLALLTTLSLRYGTEFLEVRLEDHLPKFIAVFAIWLIALYLNDFYNLNFRAWGRVFFKALAAVLLFSTFFSILYFYLGTDAVITPKTNLLLFLIISALFFIIWRRLFKLFDKNLLAKDNLAIIGYNEKSDKLLAEIVRNPGSGYQTALIFKTADELRVLTEKIKEKNIKTIVICDDFGQADLLRENLFKCLNLKINFYNYPDFYELLSGKVPVEAIGAEWFLENIKEGERNYFNAIKNAADFFGALIIFILSLPFWPLIALVIKLESRGPIFFSQVRVGKNEKEFKILKFRTMREVGNNKAMTVKDDKRITPLGSFLRKTRLDEIPQVLNILKGEMSFIGPRPERPEFISDLEKAVPFYKTRLLVKPGISGWDQVSGEYHSASVDDTLKKLQNDLFYIKNRSLYLDGIIVLKTIAAVLSRGGR